MIVQDKSKKYNIIIPEIHPRCRHKIENKKLTHGKSVKNTKILYKRNYI